MAKLTGRELAEKVGINPKNITNYVNRGNLVKDIDNLKVFDTEHPINKIWIETQLVKKGKTDQLIKSKTVDEGGVKAFNENGEEIPDYHKSETLLKFLDTQKRQKEIEKLDIEIKKKLGEVIPTELVLPVFKQHNQSILTEIKNASDNWIRIAAKRYNWTTEDTAEIKGNITTWINEGMRGATNRTITEIDRIVSEVSVKRGVGERN